MNGQELDEGVTGSAGTNYTAEYWQYDSRIGRRWNRDPVVKAHESSYAAFANNPIWIIDINGADSSLYNSTSGAFIAKGITPEEDKTAIWTVDPKAKGYDSNNPWATARKLTYNVGSSDDKKAGKKTGITGDSFRKDHPLFGKRKSITGNFAMEFGSQVYEEDLLNTTKIFIDVLAKGALNFGPTKTGPWKLWFYNQVNDDAPYDLKSAKRTNTGTVPSFAAIIMREWTICAGRLTRYDDYGNISYGYWGKLYGFSADYLLEKADENQDTKNGKTTVGVGDEPRDKEAIKLGIKLYGK